MFFLKKSTVAALFSLLVIIYQGITTPYFSFALFKLSHNNSNKDLWDGNPISNVPFGPLCPNLVPWPPAIVTTAYCPFFTTLLPNSSNLCVCSNVSFALSKYFKGSILLSLNSIVFLVLLYNSVIWWKSIVCICSINSSAFSSPISSINLFICSCLYSFNNSFASCLLSITFSPFFSS